MSEQQTQPGQPENAPQQQPAPIEQPQKKSSGIVRRIVVPLVVLAVIAIGGWVYRMVSGDVTTAKVGDCITNTVKADASDAKVVDCGSAEAKNKVVGILENSLTEAEWNASENPCTQFPTAENAIWYGKSTGKGDVWCLEPIAN